jgi:putative ABC transport system permease protein
MRSMRELADPSARRRWRVLRRFFPRGFRERRAADVLATHVALAGGPAGARGVAFWARVGWDVAATSARLRMDARSSRGSRDSNRARNPMAFVDGLFRSGALAVRTLKRSPGFALAVILILALGISANVTMFRVLDRLLLSPPEQIESPEEVKRVLVLGRSPFTGTVTHDAALSYPDYRGLTEVASFDDVAGYTKQTLTVDVEGVGIAAAVELATASYFEMLGVEAAVGRFYDPGEDALGASSHAAVLGWSFWQQRFGGERGVLGRELAIGRSTYTVVGVAPRGFTGIDIETVDVWLPLVVASAAESGGTDWVEGHNWYMMAGAVRVSGATERAEAEATLVRRRLREGVRGSDPDARVVLAPLIAARGPNASRESQVARMLAALTALVLLITCANVGNLYLARVLSRRRELAIQAALGVSRGRLFAQLIVEVAVVALAAGALAWWIGAQAAGALFRVLLPDAAAATGNGLRVLGLTVGLALLTALLTGVLPALRATRIDAGDVLRRGTATRRVLLLRRGLLLVQAALSVVLLAGSGLFIRSLQRAQSVDLGIDTSALTVAVELEGGIDFGERLSASLLRMLPVVRESDLLESATAASLAPFQGWWGKAVSAADGDSVPVSAAEGPYVYAVSGEYFETLGIPIVRGRPLADDDARPGAPPVVVVNERLAARVWPGREALGRCLRTDGDAAAPCATVVGVAADVLPSITAEDAPVVFYVPQGHGAVGASGANVILARPRDGVTPAMVRDFVRSTLPGVRRVEVAPLSDLIAPSLRAWQLGATLLSVVGVLALVIAAAGLYSMLAFDVLQRRRELGIRAALGASAPRLVLGAVAGSFTAVGIGTALGLGASLLGSRAVEALLFRVQGTDAGVYAVVCVVMLCVGFATAALPARAVTRTDPAIPLREE